MKTPNKEQAAQFLATLAGGSRLTFQTFDDTNEKRPNLSRVMHGPFARNCEQLIRLNTAGAGVFVMVAEGDGRGRKSVNVNRLRAVFVDLDGAPVEPVLGAPLAPSIVVESSPGRWHAYWLCDGIPRDQFKSAQQTLADLYHADRKVCDLPRVMRIPGFLHRKNDPWVSRLQKCSGQRYTWVELSRAFRLNARMTLQENIAEGCRNSTLFRLARAAAIKGTPESKQLKKALKVNAIRCRPPLPCTEVERTVASAYKAPLQGAVSLPLVVVDSGAFKAASHAVRTLVMLAYRKLDRFNNGAISLTWSECRAWFPREKTFQNVRKAAVVQGLIEVAIPAVKPALGRAPKAALYRVVVPPGSAG